MGGWAGGCGQGGVIDTPACCVLLAVGSWLVAAGVGIGCSMFLSDKRTS